MADRKDPYRSFRFRIEIDGIDVAGFSEATVSDSTTDAVEYREGNEVPSARKLSGLTKYGNITLKKGITDGMDIYNWRKSIVDKGAADNRKNVSLILIDEAGADKCRWDIIEAWPTKYDPSDFNAKGNEVLIENLELVHEGITRTS